MKTLTKPTYRRQVRVFATMEAVDNFSPAIGEINQLMRHLLGLGMVHDVKRPLDLKVLRADYRNHKIKLDSGATIERYVPAPAMAVFMVPVLIGRTMADPLKPSRAIQFYVKVKADDALMAAHLASSIVRHQWATPRHSVNINVSGVVEL